MSRNSINWLKDAGLLIKNDLSTVEAQLKAGREERGGILWKILLNLTCHAAINVFKDGYSKKLAKQFKDDVVAEVGIKEKQAGKYTEAISAGLGVRGVRKGMKSMEGLPAAAADGIKTLEEFLQAKEIVTFNAFVQAVKVQKTPVQIAAALLHKLTLDQRVKASAMAEELDKAAEATDDED